MQTLAGNLTVASSLDHTNYEPRKCVLDNKFHFFLIPMSSIHDSIYDSILHT